MLRLAFALLLAGPAASARAQEVDDSSIPRYLAQLRLGDTMEDIQSIYPPAHEWPSYVESRTHVRRYRVERAFTKDPAPHVDIMWLGLKHGRLVEIQLIYTAAYSRTKSVDALASDLALNYGPPRSGNGRFWWVDGRTVLRALYGEIPVLKGGGSAVELRTSIQLLESSLFPKD